VRERAVDTAAPQPATETAPEPEQRPVPHTPPRRHPLAVYRRTSALTGSAGSGGVSPAGPRPRGSAVALVTVAPPIRQVGEGMSRERRPDRDYAFFVRSRVAERAGRSDQARPPEGARAGAGRRVADDRRSRQRRAAVARAVRGCGPGFEDAGYERLQHGYDYAPSRAVCSSDDPEAAAQGRPVTVPLAAGNPWFPQPRWTPPTLRVVAAPGVSVDAQPLCDAGVLDSARALYRMATQADERTLAQHAVRFELERRQDPLALPALGAPARPTPQTEGELALASTSMPRARRRRRRATRRPSPTPRT
jgi:hypothetical protein